MRYADSLWRITSDNLLRRTGLGSSAPVLSIAAPFQSFATNIHHSGGDRVLLKRRPGQRGIGAQHRGAFGGNSGLVATGGIQH